MKFYRSSDATFYDGINTIYQFIISFLDKKCLFLRNMEPLSFCFLCLNFCDEHIGLDKSGYKVNSFLISQQKHIL